MRESNSAFKAIDLGAALMVALAAAAVYTSAVDYFFSQDDFGFLARAIGLTPYPEFTDPFGTRVLSTQLYFRAMHSIFGLSPAPYHWASVLLHALNAVLVYILARRWSGSRKAALTAGVAFATFDLAFTAVYWVSGVQDLMATTFLLAAALVWTWRVEKGILISVASAAALSLSLMSKEIGLLFPGVLTLMAWSQGAGGKRTAAALAPHISICAAAAVVFAVQSSKVAEGGAYGAALTVTVLHNLATYVKWTVDVIHPFKDRVAAVDYGAWKTAAAATAMVLLFLLTWRGEVARKAWAAAGWYALVLAPVLPLLRHTYLYYLYPAAAGAAILIGLSVFRVSGAISGGHAGGPGGALRRNLGRSFVVIVAAVLAITGLVGVRAREGALLAPDFVLPHDHVLRAAELAENAASTLPEAQIPQGADLLLVNPYAPESVDLSKGTARQAPRRSSDVVRQALRDGQVLRVLRPDLGEISFARRMDERWEDRHTLLYDAYGRLTYLGTGADIWANLSTVHLLQTGLPEESIRCSRKALELRPGHPRASLNLGIALTMMGDVEEARVHLRRAAETLDTEGLKREALKWLDSLEKPR